MGTKEKENEVVTRTHKFEKQTKISWRWKMKFTEERGLQLWRRTITRRSWEDNLWLETQNGEVNKWLIDDKDKWAIKSKMNVKGLVTTFENTKKNKWNDVIMKYRTLRINKTTYWESTKNTKDIRKRSNANYLRWITSWERKKMKTWLWREHISLKNKRR